MQQHMVNFTRVARAESQSFQETYFTIGAHTLYMYDAACNVLYNIM